MKKFISVFLSAVLALSLPVYAGAEGYVTEVEYNDESYYADIIYPGDKVSAYMDYDDTDCFGFEVTTESFVTITFLSESKDISIYLTDEDEYIISYASPEGKAGNMYKFEISYPLESGWYYLFFWDFYKSDYNYNFSLKTEKRWDEDHVHNYSTTVVTRQPACAGDSYTIYYCSGCGIKFKDDWIDRENHKIDFYDNYSLIKQPTLTETGFIKYQCINSCGYEYLEEESWIQRIYGRTRYETSFEIANTFFLARNNGYFDNVIVASGKNFADALAGSYLAKAKDAPIILSSGNNNWDIIDYVGNHLSADGTLYILGGNAAVSEDLEDDLYYYFPSCNIKRIQGRTRYETNIEILKEAGVSDQEIIVATGNNFADSLSASAVGKPILLVDNKKADISDVQKAYLETLDTDKFYIAGGEGAVSSDLENVFNQYGDVERISGRTRYETSVKIAEKFFPNATTAVLAYAQNFPDGLCGGPLAMKIDAPLILTQTGNEAVAKSYTQDKGIVCGAVLGGSSLISDDSTVYIFDNNSNVYVCMYW